MVEDASLVGVGSEEPVVPQSKVRKLEARIKQLERALGRASLDKRVYRMMRGAGMLLAKCEFSSIF